MIELANGKVYNPIVPFSYKEMVQGQQREVLEIHFKADETGEDGYTLNEIVELYKDTSPFDDIKFYEDFPNENGDYIFLSERLHFTVAVKFWAETIDNIPRYVIKIAQKTDLELSVENQARLLNALLTGEES